VRSDGVPSQVRVQVAPIRHLGPQRPAPGSLSPRGASARSRVEPTKSSGSAIRTSSSSFLTVARLGPITSINACADIQTALGPGRSGRVGRRSEAAPTRARSRPQWSSPSPPAGDQVLLPDCFHAKSGTHDRCARTAFSSSIPIVQRRAGQTLAGTAKTPATVPTEIRSLQGAASSITTSRVAVQGRMLPGGHSGSP
jgi:hypothetical protein